MMALCTRCSDLKLSAADFYLSEEEAKKTPNSQNVHDPITKDTRSWKDLEATDNCSLCRTIKRAVDNSHFDPQPLGPPHSCVLKLTRLWGSGDDDDNQYDVRYLEIVANYDWTASHGIELLPVESDAYPGCFPGRIVDPRGIDVSRVRSWLSQCQSQHGDACRHVETSEFQLVREHLLVVDVEERCLVTLPAGARYLALSYVWGNIQQPTTLKDNVDSFKLPNGLSAIYHQLPKVILDTVRLVGELGERFLWVDALCIVQDDDTFRTLLINSMHTVYKNALLTIFASSGADSNAGLPGMHPTPRGSSQLIVEPVPGLKLVSPINYQKIKRSKWASHGWTYQEYFFSQRRLLFIDGQIVYRCNKIRWREDIAQENLAKGIPHFQVDGAGSRTDWDPPAVRPPNAPGYNWSRYHLNKYVETYLDRDLTFDRDILFAFAGIINEAENRQLPMCWGLTKKHVAMDLLWMPCKWLARRPGFPSWSWAGWKGPIISYIDSSYGLPAEEGWQQRKSWVDFYIFSKDAGQFQLLSTGYAPQQEGKVLELEESHRSYRQRVKEMTKTTRVEGSDGDDENSSDAHNDGGVLASLLWRLSNSQSLAAKTQQEPPYPLHCTPTIDDQTLLFRTMTTYVHISSLNPSGRVSNKPRDDHLVLPSAPTLHLYTGDGTHIGSAWPHTQEFFDQVAAHDLNFTRDSSVDRLQIEVALLAGPLEGDWRTRNENYSTWLYMMELAEAGLNLGVVYSRYNKRLEYEQAIARVYIDMVRQRQATEQGAGDVESRLTVGFWREFKMRIMRQGLESKFPGHCEETMRPVIDGLTAAGLGMKAKQGQSFIKLMLIGHLGDGETNGGGGIKERVGLGEIRDNALGLIQGLAFRDVMLK
ncbi:heterokaryon incompatibility protein-domain-containing protein [Xylaria palmicola]|nr:heterokaryon incompatibility protein-domain-containing protein [Xylaria palmicola]